MLMISIVGLCGACGRRLGGRGELGLLSLPLERLFEHVDVPGQRVLHLLARSILPFQLGDPGFHLGSLNLPRIPIPFVSVPLRLEEAHDA